jgi:N-methylhydantoinase A
MGLIRKQRPLGNIQFDIEAARKAMSSIANPLGLSVEEAAEAIRSIVNSNMEHAIRLVTSERGLDPGEFTLLAFGGAGPLHAVEVARNLSINTIIVPRNPGLFSALGCLLSDITKDYVKTTISKLSNLTISDIKRNFATLEAKGFADMQNYGFRSDQIELQKSLDVRYLGQAYETNLVISDMFLDIDELRKSFNQLHLEMYGRFSPDLEIEIVNYRLTAKGKIAPIRDEMSPHFSIRESDDYPTKARIFFQGSLIDATFYDFASLERSQTVEGPAVIDDETSTVFVPPEWSGEIEDYGNLIIKEYKGDESPPIKS